MALLEEAVKALRVGNPLDESSQMGPLISADQQATVGSFLEDDVPVGTVTTYARALAALGVDERQRVYWAGRASLVRRPEDVDAYDRCFRAFWLGAGAALVGTRGTIFGYSASGSKVSNRTRDAKTVV